MPRFKSALLAATLLIGVAGVANAQTYDPNQLPATKGKVTQYTLSPRGDVDGLILDDGTEVHVPPTVSTELVFAVKPGDAVTVHGLKARAIPMVAAMSVTNDATGATVTSRGERGMRMRAAAQDVTGKIKAALHEPRGEVNGVLLEDGTVVRVPPNEAQRLASQLAVGQTLFARGEGVASPLGHVVMARQVGPDKDHLTEIAGPHWRGPHMLSRLMHRDTPPAAPRQ